MTALYDLPDNLPVPLDDGQALHLVGKGIPSIPLKATNGELIDLSNHQKFVLFCYPLSGHPQKALPKGWDEIPGARGCTPEVCRFRDLAIEFETRSWPLFGMSTQSPEYQAELVNRIHVPYPILSDESLTFTSAMRLPTLVAEGMTLIARTTLIVIGGHVHHVFYPIFPPDTHADELLAWIDANVSKT